LLGGGEKSGEALSFRVQDFQSSGKFERGEKTAKEKNRVLSKSKIAGYPGGRFRGKFERSGREKKGSAANKRQVGASSRKGRVLGE